MTAAAPVKATTAALLKALNATQTAPHSAAVGEPSWSADRAGLCGGGVVKPTRLSTGALVAHVAVVARLRGNTVGIEAPLQRHLWTAVPTSACRG